MYIYACIYIHIYTYIHIQIDEYMYAYIAHRLETQTEVSRGH